MAIFDFLGSALGGLGNGLGKLGDAFGFNFGGNGVNSQQIPQVSQQQLNQGNSLGGLNQNFGTGNLNGLNQDINLQNGLNARPNLTQFALGTDKQVGLLPGLGNLAQTVGGLSLANKQFALGKSQLATEKEIFNNRQTRLAEDSARNARLTLQNTPAYANASEEFKKQFIADNTQSSKFIN